MSKIEWTGKTWNPYIGCDKVSPGCENCYAIRMGYRLAHMPHTKPIYGPAVKKTAGGKLNWTGVIRENYPQMDKPLRTHKPTTFFVNSMSDLFHDGVSFEMIDDIYHVMEACPIHTFQVLTKRASRMVEYYRWKEAGNGFKFDQWPLNNVWVGVSAENQNYLDERLLHLLSVPAQIRFLSCEPLLGAINLGLYDPYVRKNLHWVIVGGESGHNSRPMHPDWANHIVNECLEYRVPVFFKQWGEFADGSDYKNVRAKHYVVLNNGDYAEFDDKEFMTKYRHEWDSYRPTVMRKVGKDKSGDEVQGISYKQFPNTHKL